MTATSNFAERLKETLILNNMRPIDLIALAAPYCEELGCTIDSASISRYLNDGVVPKSSRLEAISRALNISPAWLLGYDVKKERSAPAQAQNYESTLNVSLVSDMPDTPYAATETPENTIRDFILRNYGGDISEAFSLLVRLKPVDLGRTIAYMEQLLTGEKYNR